MRRVIGIIILLAIFILIGFVLYSNKRALENEALRAEIEVESVPVEVITLVPQKLEETFSSSGILSARRELMVMAETQGKVRKVFKVPGQESKRGELVVQVDDALLQAERLVVEANFQKAEKDLQRFERLVSCQ